MSDEYDVYIEQSGFSLDLEIETGAPGPAGVSGTPGLPGPNQISTSTDSTIFGVLVGDSISGKVRAATNAEIITESELTSALSSYLTTSSIGNTVQARDQDLDAIAALTGTGYARRTGDGTWALGEIDVPSVNPVAYPIDLGKTYANLVGTPPSVLEKSWVNWAANLKDYREANCPLAKTTSYHFAATGNDANDGSIANPWQSLSRANALMSGLNGQKVNNNTLSVADSSPFSLENRSWWMGAWVRTPSSGPYYAPIFTRTNSYGLLIGTVGVGARITPRVMTNGTDHVVWSAPLVADTWQFVEAWFDTTTRSLSIAVNNAAPVTVTKPTQFPSTTNPMTCGSGGWATGNFPGDMARAFFVRDVVPTNAQRSAMWNNGKGLRSYLLGSLRSVFVNNGGSFWDMNGVSGTTTYADAISGRTFTRNVAQNPVVIPGPDADSAVTSTNGVISGGGDFAVLFRRGDRFVGKFNCNRGNVTVADYGTGRKPIISDFSVSITNSWTLVAGTTFKRACSPVGWVKKIGDDVYPFELVLFKEVSAAAVQSRLNSFFYDTVAGELHLNVGANPASVSPSGWEGTVRGSLTPNSAIGDVNRIENLIILGSGITEPGNPSGYGLQITGTLNQEHVCKGLEVFYSGYHAIGHISTKAIGTWINCKAGLCASRNEAGLTSYVADGTVYVSYSGTGDQEMILWQCEINHGPLPSYDSQAGNNFAGYISHTADASMPALNLIYECGFIASNYPVAEAYTVGQSPITSWAQSRCWVYGGYLTGNYTSQFQIGVGLHCTYVNQNAGVRYGNIPGVLFGGLQGIWLANSTITADAASLGGAALNLFQTSAVARFVNCRVDVINSGAGGVKIANGALGSGTLFENCIFTISTTGSVILGDATTGQFDRCAFRGMTGVGTSPVNLVNTPMLKSSNNSWQLYGTGKTGITEFDSNGKTRRTIPTIGPFEL